MTEELKVIEENAIKKQQNKLTDIIDDQKEEIAGYCKKYGTVHDARQFELQFFQSFYGTRAIIRLFTKEKKCRHCGERITKDEYSMMKRLEKIKDEMAEVMEEVDEEYGNTQE